ncbi:hypothetical protein NLU13_3363 [Sarocladium strictum]|uniref:Uncharacterized protein n=1 Tax=Sarocladium strictum TaxID=5046 RepID=A0AA39GLW1_SARSR|nr:hypothetical protein NLU13_3363 [Sarocladium strictum]
MSIGLDSEDDFPYAFPGSGDPFSVSLLDSPHQESSPVVAVLQNQLQNLRAQIRVLKTERQIADGRADLALERIAEMQDRHQEALQQTERDTVNEDVDLQEQNRLLREQLSDAQSQIFSLQPYRKELTPDEIGREYDEMLETVQAWVEKLMSPYLEDHEKGTRQVLSWAKKNPAETMQFKKSLQAQPDLVHACMFPETDEDIVFSLVLRYLHDTIFQKILYGVLEHYTDVLSLVETHMQTSVEPKRDLFSVRNWTAEAYNALLSAPQFQKIRERLQRQLTMELAHKLKILCKKVDWDAFCKDISASCVQPAMQLYEKMQVSTHHFYLDINPMMAWRRDGSLITSPEFYDSVHQLDCQNILKNRKTFSLAKLDPQPSSKELSQGLLNVCAVTPALYMRRAGQRDAMKEPTLVRKQHSLVAWGPEEQRQEFLERGERTIAAQLLFSKEKVYPWV